MKIIRVLLTIAAISIIITLVVGVWTASWPSATVPIAPPARERVFTPAEPDHVQLHLDKLNALEASRARAGAREVHSKDATLRDWFAAFALMGLNAGPKSNATNRILTREAWEQANYMMEVREERNSSMAGYRIETFSGAGEQPHRARIVADNGNIIFTMSEGVHNKADRDSVMANFAEITGLQVVDADLEPDVAAAEQPDEAPAAEEPTPDAEPTAEVPESAPEPEA